jgi:hypothetical protein
VASAVLEQPLERRERRIRRHVGPRARRTAAPPDRRPHVRGAPARRRARSRGAGTERPSTTPAIPVGARARRAAPREAGAAASVGSARSGPSLSRLSTATSARARGALLPTPGPGARGRSARGRGWRGAERPALCSEQDPCTLEHGGIAQTFEQ